MIRLESIWFYWILGYEDWFYSKSFMISIEEIKISKDIKNGNSKSDQILMDKE